MERSGDLGKAAELQYGTLPTLNKELEQANEKLAQVQKALRNYRKDGDVENLEAVLDKNLEQVLAAEIRYRGVSFRCRVPAWGVPR